MKRPELPEAFRQRMITQLSAAAESFFSALGQEPVTAIRLHPVKGENPYTCTTHIPWCADGNYLPQRPVFTLDPLLHAGAYYVQEPSSMFLDHVLRKYIPLSDDLRVLDLCAAPGGKSTLLASWLNGTGLLVANEVIRGRVSILRENLAKWGYANIVTTQHDPADFAALEEWFDLIVVDAPCSGEGLFRKDPDARNEWSEANCSLCESRQQRILQDMIPALKPGGYLIYCTCTYNPGENDGQISILLDEGFSVITLTPEADWNIRPTAYGLSFYPHQTKGEGFYIALLQKNGEADVRTSPDLLRKAQPVPAAVLKEMERWVKDAAAFHWALHGQEVIAMPLHAAAGMAQLSRHLRRAHSGLHAGTLKGKDFIPAHALSLNLHINENLPALITDKNAALSFLQRNPPSVQENYTDGWHRVLYHDKGLGWAKKIGHRWNNYYPVEWRIRMQTGNDTGE